jgi:hypothetical protein
MTEATQQSVDSDSDVSICDDFASFLDEFGVDDGASRTRAATTADNDDEAPSFVPIAHEITIQSEAVEDDPSWTAAAADSLRHNGFVVLRLPKPLVPSEECESCAAACLSRLSKLLDLARSAGFGKRDVLRFTEVCARTPGGLRFDMRFGHDGRHDGRHASSEVLPPMPPCWARLTAGVESYVRKVLAGAKADKAGGSSTVSVDSTGCVTSLPGAPDQHFHPDGTAEGLVNVFCPLVPGRKYTLRRHALSAAGPSRPSQRA